VGQKSGAWTHGHNSVKSEPIKFFFSLEFLRKVIVKWILKIQPQLARVATLPCDTLMSAKKAINDKLQGSVSFNELHCSCYVLHD